MRPLWKSVDLAALRHNVRVLAAQAGTAQVVAVVKADAYGHGVAALLPVLREMPCFAVACMEEALALRALGLSQPVLLLEGVFAADELGVCAAEGFEPWLHDGRQLAWYRHAAVKPTCWLKVDSGMHRLGFAPSEVPQAVAALQGLPCRGLATHFACADEADLSHAGAQWRAFDALPLPPGWLRTAANSAALFALPQARADWVRPGLALYGMSPFADRTAADLGLRPVLGLHSAVLATHFLARGEGAGYGCGFVAAEDGYLATIALGYGDGFPRAIASGAVRVRIGAATFPLVGRVAMDMALVWLGREALPVGSPVLVFGDGHPVEVVAAQAGTIPYTLTTMLSPRVHTVVKNG